jgi:hypothetical protein
MKEKDENRGNKCARRTLSSAPSTQARFEVKKRKRKWGEGAGNRV